ncbi:hypothetical protein B0A48_00957 [Cryoendolithus antarcticus]|uniref:Uncharacterized protein n=1 Tax=Cryoendolithus antarcticus TaxID=1507870 RepID=A0A1V8TS03_9PEZI|nr:hypothetical protein B0A48_00957 [Cryoendolithus antarcticus]
MHAETGTELRAPGDVTHLDGDPLYIQYNGLWTSAKVFTEGNDNNPAYKAECRLRAPNVRVTKTSNGEVIGFSTLHPVSIHCNMTLHGRKGKLQALSNWKTKYTHLSYAYSDSAAPMPMEWTSQSSFKTWDFVCVDDMQNPVAKFVSNNWRTHKMGRIEFLGPKAHDEKAREEIVVCGLTMYNVMMLRMNNFLSLGGAFFNKTGPFTPAQIEAARREGGVEPEEVEVLEDKYGNGKQH